MCGTGRQVRIFLVYCPENPLLPVHPEFFLKKPFETETYSPGLPGVPMMSRCSLPCCSRTSHVYRKWLGRSCLRIRIISSVS